MKREIICGTCKSKVESIYKKTCAEYPEEHHLIREGAALKEYICDNCGNAIKEDEKCYAVSLWSDYGRNPYYIWEHDFLAL